jgi:sugar/nucleoside kinase (ribokinase family)
MAEARILGFGTATLDYRIRTADLGEGYTEKLLAQEVEVLGGGAVANCLVQVSRLGGSAVWLGKLGKDRTAEVIVAQLQHEGVDCSRALFDPTLGSPFNLAVYAGRRRRRVGGYLIPGSLACLSEADVSALAANVRSDDWVVVEIGEIPLDSIARFCREAKDRGARLAVDVDLDPLLQCGADSRVVTEIFRHQDLIMANQQALQSMYDLPTARALTSRLGQVFRAMTVVSAGAEGCYYSEIGGVAEHLPALYVKVVDPVGAGDAFHGGLLYALAEGQDFSRSLEIARRSAALNCTVFGAREGMPNRDALERFNPEDPKRPQSTGKEG